MIPTQTHLNRQLAVYLPVIHDISGLVESVRRDLPIAPLEDMGRSHHEFSERKTSRGITRILPILNGSTTVVDPSNARMVAADLAKSVEVLLVTDLDRVTTVHFSKGNRSVCSLIDERIELRPTNVGENRRVGSRGGCSNLPDVQHRGNIDYGARWIADDERIETPRRGVDVWIGIGTIPGNAVAVKLGHAHSEVNIKNRSRRDHPVVLQTSGHVVVVGVGTRCMKPGSRNIVGHVRPADAEVQALAVREILVQTQEEAVGRSGDGDRIEAIIAVAIYSAGFMIGLRVERHVVSEQRTLQREPLTCDRTGTGGYICLRTNL